MIKVECTSEEGCKLIQFAEDDTAIYLFLVRLNDLGLRTSSVKLIDVNITNDDIISYKNAVIHAGKDVLPTHQMDEIKSFKVRLDSITQPEYLKTNVILRRIYELEIGNNKVDLNSNYVESEYVATQNKEAIKIADLNTECIKLYARNRGLRLDVHRFTERNKKLKAEAQRKDSKIKELEAKCAKPITASVGVQFDTFMAKKQIKNKDSEIKDLKSEVAKLKAEAQAKDNSISTLQHIVDDYTAGTVALKLNDDKIKELEARCTRLNNDNNVLDYEHNELTSEIHHLKCREEENKKHIRRLRDDLKTLRANCFRLTDDNNKLEGCLSKNTKHTEFLRAELNSSRCKYDKLNDENKHLKRDMKSSEDDAIDHKTPETNISESKYDKLIEEHEQLKRKMKAFGTWWLGKYRARIKRCAELEGTIVSLESQLAVESQECTRLRDELEALKR